jgi:hypothetical protein
LSKKEISSGNPAVPGKDEISLGVSWRLTRAARPIGSARHCPILRVRQLADIEGQGKKPYRRLDRLSNRLTKIITEARTLATP